MMNYLRRFIPKFSVIARPLYLLLKEAVPYVWGEEQHEEILRLQRELGLTWDEANSRLAPPPTSLHPSMGRGEMAQWIAEKFFHT